MPKFLPVLAASFLSWALSAYIHFPTLPGSVYSDVAAFWWGRWELVGGLVPCLDFFFEYPPAACMITYAARVLGGASIEGYYMSFALMSLPAFLALGWYMWRVGGGLAALLILAPSMVLYGVYNYDHFFASLTALGLTLYYSGRRWVSYMLLGFAASMKLFSVVFLPALLLDRFRWRYVVFFLAGALPATIPVLALRPEYFAEFVKYHASWGLENSWTIWLTHDPFSPSAKVLGWLVAFSLIARALSLSQTNIGERSFLLLSGFLLGSPTFTPQMVLMLYPFIASTPSVWPLIPALEVANAGIILTWFLVENPTHAWTLPQTAALVRAVCLAAAWLCVYRGYNLLRPLQLGLSRGSSRLRLRLRSSP